MTEDMVLVVAVAMLAATALVAAMMVHLRRQRLEEFAIREREKMIALLCERFRDSDEFILFARSPEAQALFTTVDAPAALARRLLGMTALAIVLLALGAGMWINAWQAPATADLEQLRAAGDARWRGTLALACGLGLLAASFVCAKLGRRWGVLGS